MTKPTLILCRRKTGASAMANLISEFSGIPKAQSEPFMFGRQFDYITKEFYQGDRNKAYDLTMLALSQRYIIKHQYEYESYDFNLMLLQCLKDHGGYNVVLMERNNELERAYSSQVSQRFSLWSREDSERLIRRIKRGEDLYMDFNDGLKYVVRNDAIYKHWMEKNVRTIGLKVHRVEYDDIYGSSSACLSCIEELTANLEIDYRSYVNDDRNIIRFIFQRKHYTQFLKEYSKGLKEFYENLSVYIKTISQDTLHAAA